MTNIWILKKHARNLGVMKRKLTRESAKRVSGMQVIINDKIDALRKRQIKR